MALSQKNEFLYSRMKSGTGLAIFSIELFCLQPRWRPWGLKTQFLDKVYSGLPSAFGVYRTHSLKAR